MTGSVLRGTSSTTRTMDEREMATLRPAVAAPKRPRKPPVKREVTNGIVCFCGERFAESQALEFMLHLRAEYGEVLDWRERRREAVAKYNRRPDIRTRQNEYNRIRRKDPEIRDRLNDQARQRRQEPSVKAARTEYLRRKRDEDPRFREQRREIQRRYRARKRAEREAAARASSTELSTE